MFNLTVGQIYASLIVAIALVLLPLLVILITQT